MTATSLAMSLNFVMDLLMNELQVEISNEEFVDIDVPTIANSKGIVKFINSYDKGKVLTYYVSYEESESVLDEYNKYLSARNLPVFSTPNARNLKIVVDLAIFMIMVLLYIKM